MVQINNINITTKKGRDIVKKLSFVLNEGDKLAIIGEEGNGKSTLLKYFYDQNLINEYCYCEGSISVFKDAIGYLPQMMDDRWYDSTIIEYFLKDNYNSEIKYEVYNDIYKIEELFDEYGLDKNILDDSRTIRTLSGGEKVKLQLIKLMYNHPKLLLLDEPTNDLDIKTIELIEKVINSVNIPIIFISHDEQLLISCSNMILHLEQIKSKSNMRFTLEKVGYQEYIDARKRKLIQQDMDAYRTHKEYDRRKEILMHQHQLVQNHLNAAIKDPSSGRILAKKMKNVKAQEKVLEKMDVKEYSMVEEAIDIFFDDNINIPNGKTIIELKDYDIKVGNKVLVNNFSMHIKGNEHVVIVGNNGTGKTTLIKSLYDMMKDRKDINVGYMPQNYDELLNDNISAVEYLQEHLGYDKDTRNKIMTFLGSLKFVDYEMNNNISELSGGQKAKIFLVKLVLSQNDVLLLDEPTRNLSPLSTPVIKEMLKKYRGCIISISHDRSFINFVADRVIELKKTGD